MDKFNLQNRSNRNLRICVAGSQQEKCEAFFESGSLNKSEFDKEIMISCVWFVTELK